MSNPVPNMVTFKIDGREVSVPKGTNVIEAAKTIGIEIPHYCYHKNLSVAGNCRMCQVEVKGRPKLEIGCNLSAQDGMEVCTQHTSPAVKRTQEATLEFILINHPLDCTVCDQAGHCKLQDYHYEYNAKESRFIEDKVHKVKAEPLGPTVMLDGERCIMCSRCVRFCDEITKTSELGLVNRGDRTMIAVSPDRPLNNPLSGTVVDLCPVGALTHRNWRFNTRIWFTKQVESICPGCSTGCNVKVATRDNEVVLVKARMNQDVNKEWLCDEGRYGFGRFAPKNRIFKTNVRSKPATLNDALAAFGHLAEGNTAIFLSPDLLLEDYYVAKKFIEAYAKSAKVLMPYRERRLSEVESILISPDYASNFKAAQFVGLIGADLASVEAEYKEALQDIKKGKYQNVLILGDRGMLAEDLDNNIQLAISEVKLSIATLCDADSKLAHLVKVVIPGRTCLEKSGLMINRTQRLQYSERALDFPEESEPEWRVLNRAADLLGLKIVTAETEREVTQSVLKSDSRLSQFSIAKIKNELGVNLS